MGISWVYIKTTNIRHIITITIRRGITELIVCSLAGLLHGALAVNVIRCLVDSLVHRDARIVHDVFGGVGSGLCGKSITAGLAG